MKEIDLFTLTFEPEWRELLILKVNNYDQTRVWPAYEREDGLGLFAAALLHEDLPVIGYGKNAFPMAPECLFASSEFLQPTGGMARCLNLCLAREGKPPRVYATQELIAVFRKCEPAVQNTLGILAILEQMILFYKQMSLNWKNWFGNSGGAIQGKVSPVDIWKNYADLDLRQVQDDLEILVARQLSIINTMK